jgi:hypothetical protein
MSEQNVVDGQVVEAPAMQQVPQATGMPDLEHLGVFKDFMVFAVHLEKEAVASFTNGVPTEVHRLVERIKGNISVLEEYGNKRFLRAQNQFNDFLRKAFTSTVSHFKCLQNLDPHTKADFSKLLFDAQKCGEDLVEVLTKDA